MAKLLYYSAYKLNEKLAKLPRTVSLPYPLRTQIKR